MGMKKGFVFTTDMIIGLVLGIAIILSFVSLEFESIFPEKKYEKINHISDDLINVLNFLTVDDVKDKPTISSLIASGVLKGNDLNKTVLDLIGSFWYSNNKTIAENISREILENITRNICINITADTEIAYSSCNSPAREIAVRSMITSGYEIGKPVSGYIARAFLTSIKTKTTSSYVYFGGYVGEGNITRDIILPPFDSILEAFMELNTGNNFTLYINGKYSGVYQNGTSGGGYMRTDKWVVCNTTYNSYYCSNFTSGKNTLSFNYTGNNSFIGGGYFKVTYNTTQLAPEEELGQNKYWLPGIYGVINLYDSSDIPGSLTSMKVLLNISTDTPVFLEIGNTTVYEGNTSSTVENSTLSILLDYNFLSQKTVPYRIGHYILNATNSTGYVSDVVLTTSRVDDMNKIDIPNGTTNISRMSAARELDNLFVDIVLNNTGNRVGLVSYKATVPSSTGCNGWVEPLRDNKTALKCQIDNYDAQPGQRCLCCAIYEAHNLLNDPSRMRAIVLMSDGSAAITRPSQCPSNYTGDPIQDAINEACHAYREHNIEVYTIGFGADANNTLLQQIADCGGGEWRASDNYTGLVDVYGGFATSLSGKSLVYEYQKVIPKNVSSTLYPDSYIEFNYTPFVIPYDYGEISLTRETERFKVFSGDDIDVPYKEGWFNISEKVKVVDAKVTSYSSEFWTDRLYVKNSTSDWNTVYWLGDYVIDYLNLGDPFILQIPVTSIGTGNNSARIGTGFAKDNATGGSPDDRVIYTIRLKGSVGYGDAFNTSELAIADARQRLIDKVSEYVDINTENIAIDEKSISGIRWLWGPSLFKVIVWEK